MQRVGRAQRAPRFVERSARVAARGGRVRLALVADTHSAPHPRTSELVARAKPDAILLAGDIGALTVVDELARIAPTLAVRGNIDGRAAALPDALAIAVTDDADGATLFSVYLTHIAVYGPKLRAEVAARAREHGASIVVCGHSHVPFIGRDRGLTVMNPGSVGPRRFGLPIVFGTLELADGKVSLAHVSCETGEPWSP